METLKDQSVYSADVRPPKTVLAFSAFQHMLLALSLGIAVPVTVGRAAGLTVLQSSSYVAAAIFIMGVATLMQSWKGKFIGTGLQSIATCETGALAICTLAAETGGIHLVLGMLIYLGLLKLLLSTFAYKIRTLFPPEVTGTMIFTLGLSLVPTSFKYFLGTNNSNTSASYLIVSFATLGVMVGLSLFFKRLKPYSALIGIIFGYVLSIITGVFDVSQFSELTGQSLVALPVFTDIGFSFDATMIIPFSIIAFTCFVDNIGDISATQKADNPNLEKVDWKIITKGIRASALSEVVAALVGGSVVGTATSNIGIARATRITSRTVAIAAGVLLIIVSFSPLVSGVLCLMPEPVLGAALMFSMCYIMAGGFETLRTRDLDDRRIFATFLGWAAAISTMIPGLYNFLPESIRSYIASPMVMCVIVLITLTLIGRIGTKNKYTITTGVTAEQNLIVNQKIKDICNKWGIKHIVLRQLQIACNGLIEGVYEVDKDAVLNITIEYNQLQLKVRIETDNNDIVTEEENDDETSTNLLVAFKMIRNIFDNVQIKHKKNAFVIDMESDL